MKTIEADNPYFDLHRGIEIRQSDLETFVAVTRPAVEALFHSGEVIGQFTLDDDIVLWMPKRTKFSGILPVRRLQICPMPRWERDWINHERMTMGRQK